ncbi:MAG TPA: hypothetical protein VN256_22280 [Pyrinomonadaceae bacterium]|nr:hypothetical protein [Pyrinomonadaceae bacterium]
MFLLLNACATTPPPDAAGPRPNEPAYPVLMVETPNRRAGAFQAWAKFTREQGITDAPAPELQPVTATLRALPTLPGTGLHLPKVGDTLPMSEEHTREALRRFITSVSPLLGAQPVHLSLMQRIDAADGTQKAIYEQRPFRYPLRGGYGLVEITFAPDRRVLQITSTAIPEIEQLQRAGAGTRPKWTAEELPAQLAGKTFTYRDAAGVGQTLTINQAEDAVVRELVIYPRPRAADPTVLEFHLAWDVALKSDPAQNAIYFDAVTNELLAHEPARR